MDKAEQIRSLLGPELLDEIRLIREYLHQYPELSFEEYNTSATIRKLLDEWGIPYRHPIANTGILAYLRGNKPGPRIALRADMDALPIQEDSGLDYTSLNPGVMHACGHDMHMASLLGAIRILNQLKDQIQGEILFIFQPGEEKIPGGAKLMLEEDMFEGNPPDFIIAQHVLPDMKAGNVGFKPGIYMASNDEVYLTVKGKGGHAALRDSLKDPILMSASLLLRLQEEVKAQTPEGIPTVLSFGKIEGSGATNVVPDLVYLEGTFRTMNEAWRKKVHEIIRQTADEVTLAEGGSCKVEIRSGYPVLHNHEGITAVAMETAERFLGREHVESMDIRMTAEDFAWFTSEIPGMMYRFGVRDPGSDEVLSLHSSRFKSDEGALVTGISFLACLALELLIHRF